MKEFLEKKPKNLTKFQNQNNTIFILCSCKNEVLVIDYDSELRLADFCIYESLNSFRHKMSIWQKIRYIWQVLINGTPFNDQIVLSKTDIKQLTDFLSQI